MNFEGLESISESHKKILIILLDNIKKKNISTKDLLIGPYVDGEDGVCMRWPQSRLFCDILNNKIEIAVVGENYKSLSDIKTDIFDPYTEMDKLCIYLNKIIYY